MSQWVFGYGSLLWKVDFEYKRKQIGHIKNFERQFWLLSDDHRGTPDRPGRVVTLVPSNDICVYGVAYEIEQERVQQTFEHLDFREKCGYSKFEVKFYPLDETQEPFACHCYYANECNQYYSKETNLEAIARHILTSKGPSGTNVEYLLNLCDALRAIFMESNLIEQVLEYEKHIFLIENHLKQLQLCSS